MIGKQLNPDVDPFWLIALAAALLLASLWIRAGTG